MSECKENVLEIIDKAFRANHLGGYCNCRFGGNKEDMCNYCKIEEGLTVARACIVASVGRLDVMRSNMFAIQEEIEGKLRAILEERIEG